MKRIPEPELMDEADQATAYACADFEEPHNHFIEFLKTAVGEKLPVQGHALDLGCGAADISIRFARAFQGFHIEAVDGAEAMLIEARKALATQPASLQERIRLVQKDLRDYRVNDTTYALMFSNSLLHHLHDPMLLWQQVRTLPENTSIFIMDLMRPENESQVDQMVSEYASNEPEVLQRDFRNSLFAAFTPPEVENQLSDAGLTHLMVEVVSDRHLVIRSR